MKSLFYSWMVFQILVGIWLFISPFVLEGETHLATNSMIFGAIVVILGVGTLFYGYYHKEMLEREPLSEMEHAKQRV
jgi:hypothetical protein